MAGLAKARSELARVDLSRILLAVYIGLCCMILALERLPATGALLFTALSLALAAAGAELVKRGGDGDGKSIDALCYGLGMLAWSALFFGLFVNWLAAALALTGAACQVLTSRVRSGGVSLIAMLEGSGLALSVLVGWAAAVGALHWEAALPFTIVFYWALPRAWSLADESRATRYRLGFTTIQLCLVSFLPGLLPLAEARPMLGGFYLLSAGALALPMLWLALRQMRQASAGKSARQFATLYLALLFCAMLGDRLLI